MLIQRHMVKEFLKALAVMALGLALVVSLLDFVRTAASLADSKPGAWDLLMYAALGYPNYLVAVLPVTTLMASLLVMSMAARNRELVAIIAAGGRLRKLLLPFVLTGVLLSAASFALTEFAAPEASSAAIALKNSMRGHKAAPAKRASDGATWVRGTDGALIRFDVYSAEDNVMAGLSVYRFDGDILNGIVTASSGRYLESEGTWLLKDVTVHDLQSPGQRRRLGEMRYAGLQAPSVLTERISKSIEMGALELSRYLRRLKQAGFHNRRLVVELHAKFAQPFIVLIMLVLGVSFPAHRDTGGLRAAAFGLLFSILYWVGFGYCQSAGISGVFSPLLAAWLMPAAFLSLAFYFYTRIPE